MSNKTKTIVLTTLIILMFPFISLATTLGLLLLSARQLTSQNNKSVKTTMAIAKTFAVIGSKESKALSYIPLIGMPYKETGFLSNISEKSLSVIEDGTVVARDLSNLLNNVLGKSPYDPTALLSGTKSQMQSVYSDILDIHNMTTSGAERGIVTAKIMLSRLDFKKYENLALQGIVLIDKTPEILGKNQSKTYLVLFQNNMELRPTGGFIGSYGLLTFNSGRLSDFGVSDVYSADGQLNGHVEPPAPIKNYLGEANWWLRDSNWDPDFPTSAKRAEWFLDKEIDKQVDGVISVDLSPIREILKITGPIFLPDYNLKVDSDNLYEETQSEAQDNFFPGAHNKVSFLTALSRSLLGELETINYKQKVSTLLSFYKSLEERHIQVFLHEGEPQNAINQLGWDGSVSSKECGEGCYSDMLGVVEANVGFNKANYFVKRNATLEVKLYPGKVDRKLTFILTDSANPGLGVSGRYKSYIRFLIPGDSINLNIKNTSGQNSEILNADIVDIKGRKEVGVLVEVLPGQKKEISFEWTSHFIDTQPSSYGIYLRKQAGVDGYPIELNLDTQNQVKGADSRFALTKEGIYTYNTTLSKDLFATFFLK